jgi:hypothetical protein
MKLLIEAIVVGISIIIFGSLMSFVAGLFFKTELPPVCKDWNKNYVMEIALFLTGFVAHLFFEVSGVNKWYCKNGNACK